MTIKIYYVDDELDLLEIFVETFSAKGREIPIFNDPLIAIKAIQENPPDLLFLDYRLPNYTGDQIAHMTDPRIPKILITGDMSANCTYIFDAIYEKPYKIEKIEKMIEKFTLT